MNLLFHVVLFLIGGLFGMLAMALVVMSRDIGDK